MTTTKTITVSLSDSAEDEAVSADYFQIEEGWITFKAEGGEAVASYPEKRVTRIKSAPPLAQSVAAGAVGGQRFLAEAFDIGFTTCANEHTKQRKDPSYPITRINPYEARK